MPARARRTWSELLRRMMISPPRLNGVEATNLGLGECKEEL